MGNDDFLYHSCFDRLLHSCNSGAHRLESTYVALCKTCIMFNLRRWYLVYDFWSIRAVLTVIFELGTQEGFRDHLAANTTIVVWCIVERSSAIIGACLPQLVHYFKEKAPKVFSALSNIHLFIAVKLPKFFEEWIGKESGT
ncbi:08d350ff-dd48-44fd-bfb5-c7cfe9f0a522 [Sclerotinia trifoliorum]|uniref:08d350ff-dd48-44fd-bfb5-c7cfe9f0a522 n=1 Tax=Sclerotinia trifoliorum TaxID=28548 RepID=A0A8H2VZL4_9HELO|nr:08d350ff-dd48-44fd-bfb5-c7cfe9f0a522 [Sclerotinia trifoliorum]